MTSACELGSELGNTLARIYPSVYLSPRLIRHLAGPTVGYRTLRRQKSLALLDLCHDTSIYGAYSAPCCDVLLVYFPSQSQMSSATDALRALSYQTFAKKTQKSFIRLLAPLKTFV